MVICLPLLVALTASAGAVKPWDEFNFSPKNRDISPVKIHRHHGVTFLATDIFPLTLDGAGAFVVLDFGKNVGGFTTLTFGNVDPSQEVGLAYSESTNYAACPPPPGTKCARGTTCSCVEHQDQRGAGDHSNGDKLPDGTLRSGTITSNITYRPGIEHMRGAFRYMNVFLLGSSGKVQITNATVFFTAAPTMPEPSAYSNHFHSSDDLVTRIWYAAAYTVQMCSIDPAHGRQWGPPTRDWNNGVLIGTGKTLLVDGAKRDRTIWPGDMGISTDTAHVTTGDLQSSKESLNTLYALQSPSGMLPYVGPEVFCHVPWKPNVTAKSLCGKGGSWHSDTYHLWALIGTANVLKYSSASEGHQWLASGIWEKYKAGLDASLAKVNRTTGLMQVTATADWQRGGMGGENIEANVLLMHALYGGGGEMAPAMADRAAGEKYLAEANSLKSEINTRLWDEAKGAYKDNTQPTTTLYPQDGNSLAVWFNATDDSAAPVSCPNAWALVDEWGPSPGHPPVRQATLSCANSSQSFTGVEFASFGTPTGSSCTSLQVDKGCHAVNSTKIIEALCIGKSSCTLPADPTIRGADNDSPLTQLFGDPCWGKYKRLAVRLSGCDPPPPVPRKARVLAYLKSLLGPLGAESPEWSYEGKNAIGTFPGSMQVNAHMASGDTENGLEMLKRQWGYMIQCPNSTQSTFWEGFQADGQFAFQGIYMSHAHGWGTGAAGALQYYVVGIKPLPQHVAATTGRRFVVAPKPPRSLSWVNGSLTIGGAGGTPVAVAWKHDTIENDTNQQSCLSDGWNFHLTVDTTGARSDSMSVGVVGIPLQPATQDGIAAFCHASLQGASVFAASSLVGTVSSQSGITPSVMLTAAATTTLDGLRILGTEAPDLGLAAAATDVPRVWLELTGARRMDFSVRPRSWASKPSIELWV